jgi:hypothetical protein
MELNHPRPPWPRSSRPVAAPAAACSIIPTLRQSEWTSAAVSRRSRLSRDPGVSAARQLRIMPKASPKGTRPVEALASARSIIGGACRGRTCARVAPRPRLSKPAPCYSANAPGWSGRSASHRRPPRPKRGALLAALRPDGVPCGYCPRSSRFAGERLAIRPRERVGCRTGTAPAPTWFTARRLAFRLPTPRVAGEPGFEPGQAVPKPAVLPLHNSPLAPSAGLQPATRPLEAARSCI